MKDGMIYINGESLPGEKDYPAMTDAGLAEEPMTLGTNQYFVLGDNRNNSEDSRYADVGVVSSKNIEGKVWFVLSPSDHIGFVK
ncbi:MAG: signal peptidase I [Blautia sp.]